ncbi:hypothetical protein TNCV_1569211 [Trichonephila clavipes]|nr:hypothetical protein TNCV_1569211 [Trichonephila clavipes]
MATGSYMTPIYSRSQREKSLENRGRRLERRRKKRRKETREREETEKEKKKSRERERERGAGLGWRKGFSPRLEWKDDERRWR